MSIQLEANAKMYKHKVRLKLKKAEEALKELDLALEDTNTISVKPVLSSKSPTTKKDGEAGNSKKEAKTGRGPAGRSGRLEDKDK